MTNDAKMRRYERVKDPSILRQKLAGEIEYLGYFHT